MRAYKFRSASSTDKIFDIILNRRLYCADWRNLNDPLEGIFAFGTSKESRKAYDKFLGKIRNEKGKLKVCSLSATFDCHLLWAHYADGFNGVAIEVELPDHDPRVQEVKYRGVFAYVNCDGNMKPLDAAKDVLFSKYDEWAYEKEIRILSHDEYYSLDIPVKRVIAGHRMNPALFDALQLICETQDIPIYRVGIGDEGLDADSVPPSRFSPLASSSRRGR
ncbi:hypothetical protein H261_20734 [Paramagnetospirillum caucaseum]|uniref:DUF2971 domain-containing protein n=1 Tax=Paramagnetospirillum caucaseum TaxID=1244869 RepID=M2ZL03_9PROT|nr:DUF2971 domain-containing protein [Paramagnetospirillum caucaseum]EME67982.1 hypothetical protein H261_20734 [Paramagnetospirillum caucaseum]